MTTIVQYDSDTAGNSWRTAKRQHETLTAVAPCLARSQLLTDKRNRETLGKLD